MADNVVVDNGALVDYTVATDDIGGVHYQRLKMVFGADGSAADVADGAPLPIGFPKAASATVTSFADQATAVTFAGVNAARKMLIICNNSTEILYVKLGTSPTTSSFSYKVLPNGHLELPQPMYTGAVTGIWAADASGAALVTEY